MCMCEYVVFSGGSSTNNKSTSAVRPTNLPTEYRHFSRNTQAHISKYIYSLPNIRVVVLAVTVVFLVN